MRPLLAFIIFLQLTGLAWGEDLREASQKAKAVYQAALAEAKESKQRILEDKQTLQAEVARIEQRTDALKADIAQLEQALAEFKTAPADQSLGQPDGQMDMRAYVGVVREVARDLHSLLSLSIFTALAPNRLERLEPVLDDNRFPGISEIQTISALFFEEMALSGEVDLRSGTIIEENGAESTGNVLTVGPFTAVYEKDGHLDFLRFSETEKRLFALSTPPPFMMRRNLKQYMRGKSDAVYLDLSKGAALRQIVHHVSFIDQIKNGGLVVWPILGIGLFALLITIERIAFLNRVHVNTDRLMGKVNVLAGQGDWDGCDDVLIHHKGKPVYNVLKAGLQAINEKRETLESVLQEAILRELPRLERFLPALNILGAISPLLGLLGTVTGMIATFQVITVYGTGDPRMMSGGISEALVTTMLGLSVAIPIMLVHTFLRRRVEHIIGDMEEKAVALSNIICRECRLEARPQKKVAAPVGSTMARR